MRTLAKNRRRGGFTLAEVAVTIAIVGIALTLAMQTLNGATLRAAHTRNMKTARELGLYTLGQIEAGLYWEDIEAGLGASYSELDFPDFYYPGYIRALDRLIALDAAHYIPSHLDPGSRQDLIDFRNMTAAFHEAVRAELAGNDYHAADGAALRRSIKAVYDKLEPEYGDWHGFNEMFVPKFGRHWGGSYLGY